MIAFSFRKMRNIAAAAGVCVAAACAAPPPPPPAPKPVAIPSRPLPPGGAATSMAIPAVGPDGLRQTVNAHVSAAQRVWNFRSAYNVAALNCLQPQHAPILDGYKSFLSRFERDLSRTNKTVEGEWRKNEGSGYKRARDTYTTQVYNYWALPPVLPQFCDAVLQIGQQEAVMPSSSLDIFAEQGLVKLEGVFNEFYQAFERYQVEVADWDARYGPMYGYSQRQYTNATYSQPVVQSPQ